MDGGNKYMKHDEIYEEHEVENFYNLNENNKMNNGIGKLDWENVKSGLVYAVLWGLLAVAMQVYDTGSVFALSWQKLVDVFFVAFLGFAISAVKNLLTTNAGNFLGAVKVVPEKE